jgi:hypothetical protein
MSGEEELRIDGRARLVWYIWVFVALFLPFASAHGGQAEKTSDPAAVLRDILSASCSQDSKRFATFLTVRNQNAFATMTPAAQSTLLKRFVLLDQAGTPRAETDHSGNVIVDCATPTTTTQLQIGKAEIHDNIAYLPLAVKDAADSSNTNTRRVLMGLVRENNEWKLLSLGVLLLDLPTLAEEWDREEIQDNEKAAIQSLKELAAAIEKYRVTYTHLPQTLAELGPGSKGEVKSDHAGLLGADLAAGRKNGYAFRYVIVGANDVGAPAIYELAAIPLEYGRTGTHSFFRDGSGALHAGDHQGAVGNVKDPTIE